MENPGCSFSGWSESKEIMLSKEEIDSTNTMGMLSASICPSAFATVIEGCRDLMLQGVIDPIPFSWVDLALEE